MSLATVENTGSAECVHSPRNQEFTLGANAPSSLFSRGVSIFKGSGDFSKSENLCMWGHLRASESPCVHPYIVICGDRMCDFSIEVIKKGNDSMSKKRKKSVPVPQPKQEKKMIINMNEMNLKKQHMTAGFRTGKFMTEKDRPRKKDWKREYERDKGSGKYGEYGTDPFLVLVA